jgi:hypothetical protein
MCDGYQVVKSWRDYKRAKEDKLAAKSVKPAESTV